MNLSSPITRAKSSPFAKRGADQTPRVEEARGHRPTQILQGAGEPPAAGANRRPAPPQMAQAAPEQTDGNTAGRETAPQPAAAIRPETIPGVKIAQNQPPASVKSQTAPVPVNPGELVNYVRSHRKEGVVELVLQLKPAALGRAVITMVKTDKTLSLDFRVEEPEAQRAVEAQVGQLREALKTAGFLQVEVEVHPPEQALVHSDHTESNGEERQTPAKSPRRSAATEPAEGGGPADNLALPRYLGYNTFDLIA